MKGRRLARTLLVGMAVIGPVTILAPQRLPAQRSAFEVVSVKLHRPPILRTSMQLEPARFVAEAVTLKMLVLRAFALRQNRVIGAPPWVDSERYDLEAKVEGTIPRDDLPLMLQRILIDRFQLKVHRETREFPVYELLLTKSGLSKLKISEDQTPAAPPPVTGQRVSGPLPRGAFGFGTGSINARAVPLSDLVNFLETRLDRFVLDKTGLTGLFDIKLEWAPGSEQAPSPFTLNANAPSPPVNVSGPSIFTAIQEQLGLKLESAKGPVEILVIDSVQRPLEN